MKRIGAFVILLVVLITFGSCSKHKNTVERFFEGLRVYDREIMSDVMNEFPDNSRFAYVDDIFNDEGYRKTYVKLYSSVDYKVVSTNGNIMKVEVTMPNVQKLYTDVSAWVLTQAMTDAELQARLEENEYNGVLLIQEIMYSYAVNQPDQIETMTEEFEIRFTEDGKIQCTDSIRALMTGNLFLSKNIRIGSGE